MIEREKAIKNLSRFTRMTTLVKMYNEYIKEKGIDVIRTIRPMSDLDNCFTGNDVTPTLIAKCICGGDKRGHLWIRDEYFCDGYYSFSFLDDEYCPIHIPTLVDWIIENHMDEYGKYIDGSFCDIGEFDY